MAWTHKWWKANAFLVASTLRVLVGVQRVIFAEPASSSNRGCNKEGRRISNFATATEGTARGLFTMMVVLLSSCVGFGTYWHWSDEMALTNDIIASSNCHNQNCAKSKRALRMEVIGGFALPLLVTVCIYLYRWNNRAMIRSLNRNFKTIYHSQQNSRDDQWEGGSGWEQYGRLATKQVFEVMALGVLWVNLKPFSHIKHDGDTRDYHVGKLISSMVSMLPAIVCLLVSIEMGINFSLLARRLSALNLSLDCLVHCISVNDYMKRVNHEANVVQTQYMQGINNSLSCNTNNKRSYLRNLIIQFDEIGQFTVDMVQFYAPMLLHIIGMHFVLFTMQKQQQCMFNLFKLMLNFFDVWIILVCYIAKDQFIILKKSILLLLFSQSPLKYLILFPLYVVLDDHTVTVLGRLSAAAHRKDRNIIHKTYDSKELDKCITTLSLIVNRIRDETNLYGYFDLDRSLVMTIIASTCSYLIVLIQVL
uniref:Gustatory receptor n=1 Tax=Anopheles funestus TaxID=62324 RepID=A0A4Y0BM31_ANOFN